MTIEHIINIFVIINFLLFWCYNSYNVSVIMSIYNTGRYLNDSIGSVLNQTIKFENIQIILVNDGSIDETEEICLFYKSIFPKNIYYIKTEHSGVSAGRNIGMKYSLGTFINFLDPDDKWKHNAFKHILTFFENFTEINFVAGRIKFFELINNYHPLDYKFNDTKIININKEYDCIQLSASSSFFRKSLIENLTFDEKIFTGEDTLFINKLLLLKPKYGLVKQAVYFYRKRFDSSSAVQNNKFNIHFYYENINFVPNKLVEISKSLYNKIVPFIQFLIAYEFIFRIQSDINKYLDSVSFHTYNILLIEQLKQIDDKYILGQKCFSNKYKLLALYIKHNEELTDNYQIYNNTLKYMENTIMDLNNENDIIKWRFVYINNNKLHLEGIDNFYIPKVNYFFFCRLENKTYYPKYIDYPHSDHHFIYGLFKKGRIIVFDIPLSNIKGTEILYFYIKYINYTLELYTSFTWFSHIANVPNGYYISEDYIIKIKDNRFIITKNNIINEIKCESLLYEEIINRKKGYIIKLRNNIKNYNKFIKHSKLEIWMINDMIDKAGENGEYIFRYLNKKKYEKLKVFFVISKNSSDYKRLKKLGNIIDYYSYRYLNIFLKSNKIISSISDEWTYSPYEIDYKFIKDLLHFDYIFLNNEIIKDDLSRELNKYRKDFNIILTSSIIENKALSSHKYGYMDKNLIIAQSPKFNHLKKLKDKSKLFKRIIIYPTYRKSIKGTINSINHKSIYYNSFIYTEFFNFYNNLINNKKLLLIMKEYNYTGILCINSYFSSQWIDYNGNDIFEINNNCDREDILLNSSLLITDYMNIFFDYSYLRKPIIYIQFDYEEYITKDTPKGLYNYDKDGFGPVCKDIKCTIDEIIFLIQNNCKVRLKYLRKIKKFFHLINNKRNEDIFKLILNGEGNKKNIELSYIIILFIIILKLFYKRRKRKRKFNHFELNMKIIITK